MLAGIGVDYAQGHFVGKPIAIESVLADLEDKPVAASA
jgi:EAL domain-containing protein (putative c-di-GMP-specific phosphodiesterase class I)